MPGLLRQGSDSGYKAILNFEHQHRLPAEPLDYKG